MEMREYGFSRLEDRYGMSFLSENKTHISTETTQSLNDGIFHMNFPKNQIDGLRNNIVQLRTRLYNFILATLRTNKNGTYNKLEHNFQPLHQITQLTQLD